MLFSKENNILGDCGWCSWHGGCHDKTFTVTKENEARPWLDSHVTWYANDTSSFVSIAAFLLVEEAENERMHLLTALDLKEPSLLFRFCVIASQGLNCVDSVVCVCYVWVVMLQFDI